MAKRGRPRKPLNEDELTNREFAFLDEFEDKTIILYDVYKVASKRVQKFMLSYLERTFKGEFDDIK